MVLLVRYVDFHPDNYQGGSGKSFEFQLKIEVPGDTRASDLYELIHRQLSEEVRYTRPFNVKGENYSYKIQTVELL